MACVQRSAVLLSLLLYQRDNLPLTYRGALGGVGHPAGVATGTEGVHAWLETGRDSHEDSNRKGQPREQPQVGTAAGRDSHSGETDNACASHDQLNNT